MTVPVAAPRVLVVRNDATAPVALLGRWWRAVGLELVDVLADEGGEVPPTVPDGVAGVVAMGGSMSATSDADAPWLPAERALLADAVDRGVPVLGVCLGAQLMTVALGGRVQQATPGEAGVIPLELTAAAEGDPLFGVLPPAAPVMQYHHDEMVTLPRDAVLLAATPGCRHQAWRIGDRAWAVQGHPEVDAAIVEVWAREDGGHARRCGTRADAVVRAVVEQGPRLTQVWRPFADAFARVVGTGR